MYIDISKILDILETLPEKDISYEIISNYSLSLIYYYENATIKVTIVPHYHSAAMHLEIKDLYVETRFVEEHLDKIKELVAILKEVESRMNFADENRGLRI